MQALRVGLEWFLNPDHLPLLIGQEYQWFQDAGIALDLIEPDEHLDAMAAIAQGKMDIAITEPIHLVGDVAKGEPAVGFARFLHTNGGVMYFRERGITRPRDMVGKRVQYPGAPGPGGLEIVRTMIEADGGTCDLTQLTPVNNSFYHTDAIAEDKADVATLVFYNFEVVEARHRGFAAEFFALKDWGIPDFCQLILITSASTFAEKAHLFQSFLRVLQRGIDFIHQHPDQAAAVYFQRTGADPQDPLTRDIFNATVPCFTFDFTMSSGYYQALSDWMLATHQIPQAVEPFQCWTNQLVV
jgi:putative hydroxymethylpyrimidine transport system substrate-binding protein